MFGELTETDRLPHLPFQSLPITIRRDHSEPGGTRWHTGGEVKGKLANGVGSQYSHATSERGLSSITQADAHTSAVSSRLNGHPHRFKWTRPFRGKTKYGFCACAITFRTSYTTKFNILKFCMLIILQLRVLCGSRKTQYLLLYTSLTDWFL